MDDMIDVAIEQKKLSNKLNNKNEDNNKQEEV